MDVMDAAARVEEMAVSSLRTPLAESNQQVVVVRHQRMHALRAVANDPPVRDRPPYLRRRDPLHVMLTFVVDDVHAVHSTEQLYGHNVPDIATGQRHGEVCDGNGHR